MYTDKYNYSYKCMYTQIILHIVDIHEKGIITHIEVCIHKYKYSYTCLYTQT